MRSQIVICFTFAALLLGCGKVPDENAAIAKVPPVALTPLPPQSATPEDWKKALEASFVMSHISDEGEGVTRFAACFKKIDNVCSVISLASRDAFRKRRFFMPGIRSAHDLVTYVPSYISLGDNERPFLFLAPYFQSRDGWLFMKKVAIMVDGDVVLEEDFGNRTVKRETENRIVSERFDFTASQDQIAALRKIKPESNLLIRLTGDKGYVSLKNEEINSFKNEVPNLLAIYDSLNLALEGKVPPETPKVSN